MRNTSISMLLDVVPCGGVTDHQFHIVRVQRLFLGKLFNGDRFTVAQVLIYVEICDGSKADQVRKLFDVSKPPLRYGSACTTETHALH